MALAGPNTCCRLWAQQEVGCRRHPSPPAGNCTGACPCASAKNRPVFCFCTSLPGTDLDVQHGGTAVEAVLKARELAAGVPRGDVGAPDAQRRGLRAAGRRPGSAFGRLRGCGGAWAGRRRPQPRARGLLPASSPTLSVNPVLLVACSTKPAHHTAKGVTEGCLWGAHQSRDPDIGASRPACGPPHSPEATAASSTLHPPNGSSRATRQTSAAGFEDRICLGKLAAAGEAIKCEHWVPAAEKQLRQVNCQFGLWSIQHAQHSTAPQLRAAEMEQEAITDCRPSA